MDELDLFRDFRREVAAPSEDARRRASARLARAVDREQTPGTNAARLIGKLPRYPALALAVLVGAAGTALFVSTPWKTSPGFLERAQAVLTPPAGMILHEKWETTTTSTDPACTVTRGPHEVWIDGTPPHRYRLLANDFGEGSGGGVRALACWRGTAAEFGGTQESFDALRFLPPNTLIRWKLRYGRELDPAKRLRDAMNAGTAQHEGKTQLDGRTVERIRIDPPSDCPDPPCSREPGYAYVDPETFYPVRTEGPGYIAEVGGSEVVRFRIVERFLTFEYLSRTEANLALTDIRAQHPSATGP